MASSTARPRHGNGWSMRATTETLSDFDIAYLRGGFHDPPDPARARRVRCNSRRSSRRRAHRPTSWTTGTRSRRPRPSAQADGARPVAWDRDGSRARSTTPSTPSTAATSRICSTSTPSAPSHGRRRMQPLRQPPTTCSSRSRRRPSRRARHRVRGDAGGDPRRADEQEGIDAGEAAAAAMLDAREDDGFMAPFTPVIGTDPGDWRPMAGRRRRVRSRRVGRRPEAVPDREPIAVPLARARTR